MSIVSVNFPLCESQGVYGCTALHSDKSTTIDLCLERQLHSFLEQQMCQEVIIQEVTAPKPVQISLLNGKVFALYEVAGLTILRRNGLIHCVGEGNGEVLTTDSYW